MRDTMRGLAVVVAMGASLCAAWASWQKTKPEPHQAGAAQQMMMGQDMSNFKGFHNPIPYTEKLRLDNHLVKGKTVVFEFGAAYCSMCRAYAPRMTRLDEQSPDIVVKTILTGSEAVHGTNPNSLAHRLGVTGIPAFRIYGPDGKLVAQGTDAQARVDQLLLKAGI
ncbi:MAG: thioredoxin family protein [Armatimonadetes bacterium]|nr:thioredoxin family protein [Armatimonadota bacterium]